LCCKYLNLVWFSVELLHVSAFYPTQNNYIIDFVMGTQGYNA
jgi:hypothetical protein